jgi:hypothetical protein
MIFLSIVKYLYPALLTNYLDFLMLAFDLTRYCLKLTISDFQFLGLYWVSLQSARVQFTCAALTAVLMRKIL